MPPRTIYSIGLDTTGNFDQMSNATAMGIITVFQLSLAALAADSTGATIRATTAGRIPLNTGDNMELFLIISGVRKIAMASIMKNEGRIVPNAAQIDPFTPLSLSPTATEILTARIPALLRANQEIPLAQANDAYPQFHVQLWIS